MDKLERETERIKRRAEAGKVSGTKRGGSHGQGMSSRRWHKLVASVLNVFGGLSWVGGLLWIGLVVAGVFIDAGVSPEAAYFAVVGIAAWAGLSGAFLFGFASIITLLVDLRTFAEREAG